MLFHEAESLLEKWKHPDPYHPPTAPGGKSLPCSESDDGLLSCILGSKYERNIPAPLLARMFLTLQVFSRILIKFSTSSHDTIVYLVKLKPKVR